MSNRYLTGGEENIINIHMTMFRLTSKRRELIKEAIDKFNGSLYLLDWEHTTPEDAWTKGRIFGELQVLENEMRQTKLLMKGYPKSILTRTHDIAKEDWERKHRTSFFDQLKGMTPMEVLPYAMHYRYGLQAYYKYKINESININGFYVIEVFEDTAKRYVVVHDTNPDALAMILERDWDKVVQKYTSKERYDQLKQSFQHNNRRKERFNNDEQSAE